jgi:hypothetical protein
MISGLGFRRVKNALPARELHLHRSGEDLVVTGYL